MMGSVPGRFVLVAGFAGFGKREKANNPKRGATFLSSAAVAWVSYKTHATAWVN